MDLRLQDKQMDLKLQEIFLYSKTSSTSLLSGSRNLRDSQVSKRFLYMEEISSTQVTPTGISTAPKHN
jgi:hypothetical protein